MPSPIAHTVSGYAIIKLWPAKEVAPKPKFKSGSIRRWPVQRASSWLLIYSIFISVSPDLDFVPQILTGVRYHHGPSHSLTFALGVAIAAYLITRRLWSNRSKRAKQAIQIGWLSLVLYLFHLGMDMVTAGGNGIQLLWPLSAGYYRSSIVIFPSTHWSKGLLYPGHFTFLVFELGYSVLIIIGIWLLERKRQLNRKE